MATPLQKMKAAITQLRTSESTAKRLAYHGLRALWKPAQFVVDGRFRSVVLMRYRAAPEVHQVSNMTWVDRYPQVFACCAELLADSRQPSLLSYGCSTGEEVVTLRRYLPAARILGVDINPWNLRRCRRLRVDSKIHFELPDEAVLCRHEPFDAIFCMAVLQDPRNRRSETLDSSRFYPFARFDEKLSELDRYLRPGGYLIVDGTDYRFSDTSIFSRYRAAKGDTEFVQQRPMFSRTNRRLSELHRSHRIFQKRSSA